VFERRERLGVDTCGFGVPNPLQARPCRAIATRATDARGNAHPNPPSPPARATPAATPIPTRYDPVTGLLASVEQGVRVIRYRYVSCSCSTCSCSCTWANQSFGSP
jgi:hypothetical protein